MRDLRLTLVAIAACTQAAPAPGPVARSLEIAADDAALPVELVAAIAIEEGGIRLPSRRVIDLDDHVPVGGALELRHGRVDTLALGASLVGSTEDALRTDTDLGTRAGARVVARLGATMDPATWPAALERLSGMDDASARDYANRVLAIVRTGGDFAARDGEIVHLEPRDAPEAAPAAERTKSDFPGGIWFTTSCSNKCTVGRPLGKDAVDKIVIHDTEGGWDGSVATLQNDGGKSVHYIVDADGSRVGQFRPESDTTWHAGNYFYNETSIGIEHVGQTSDPKGYADDLYATSAKLVASIRSRWPNIPVDRAHVIGHYQVPNENLIKNTSAPCGDLLASCEADDDYGGVDNHRDPGAYWDWCGYMAALGGHCTAADGGEPPPLDGASVPIEVSHDVGGCSTGGAPNLLAALSLLALRRRRR